MHSIGQTNKGLKCYGVKAYRRYIDITGILGSQISYRYQQRWYWPISRCGHWCAVNVPSKRRRRLASACTVGNFSRLWTLNKWYQCILWSHQVSATVQTLNAWKRTNFALQNLCQIKFIFYNSQWLLSSNQAHDIFERLLTRKWALLTMTDWYEVDYYLSMVSFLMTLNDC